MIVSRREAERIYDGRKCQHRLPLARRAPEPDRIVPITYRQPNEALGYDRYGHPREEAIRICYVRIVERWSTFVHNASADDLADEGYPSFDIFEAEWPDSSAGVWILRFEVEPAHQPRLLSGRIIAGRQGSYVGNSARALPGEPEAIDPFTQERYANQAYEDRLRRDTERRALRGKLPFGLRLAAIEREARARHVDIRDELRAIRRWTDQRAREKQLRKAQAKLQVGTVG